jgi:IS5 family transposase
MYPWVDLHKVEPSFGKYSTQLLLNLSRRSNLRGRRVSQSEPTRRLAGDALLIGRNEYRGELVPVGMRYFIGIDWTRRDIRRDRTKSFFGYKNHVNADAKHKLIRRYEVTELLTKGNTSADVFADSAYRSAEIEAKLKASGFKSRIHRRANRNHPLSDAQTRANRAKSRIRARIEHVFGAQQSSAGGRIVRTIGIMRARAKIGLQNLAYNIRRLVALERMAAA